jgi:hypothetical protein
MLSAIPMIAFSLRMSKSATGRVSLDGLSRSEPT